MENVEQVNLITFCDTRPTSTQNNTNYYSTFHDDEDDAEDKTITHSDWKYDVTKRTEPVTYNFSIKIIEYLNKETLLNTSKIKFESNQFISDAGSTGNFILPGAQL